MIWSVIRILGLRFRATGAVLAMLLIGLTPLSSFAQSSKGVLVGRITDPSGAVVGGANVKARNKTTGVERDTVAEADGQYRMDAVDPGLYTITITANGFKGVAVENVLVAAAQSATNDVKLEVGPPSEIISVVGDSEVILQQQDGSRTNTLDERQIRDLPIANLNPTSLVFTLPGVVAPGTGAGFVQGTEFSINGLRPRANNQLIDGTENNDVAITGQLLQPILRDGYKEVTILGADNSAEYGRGGGAVTNVITNSGSNRFHGSGYDVINSSALSSLSAGAKANQSLTSVPVSIENIPGFSFGGPIKKDKLFFFGSMQWDRVRSGGIEATAVVPTEAGFQELRSMFPTGASANLDRYLNFIGGLRGTTNVVQIPFGGAGRPATIPFGTASASSAQPVNDLQWIARVDWTPSDKNSVSLRHLFDNQTFSNQIPSAFPGFEIDVPGENNNFLGSFTHVFSERWVNEFRVSYGRLSAIFGPRDQSLASSGPTLAVPGISAVGLSAAFPQGRILNNYQLQDTITHTFSTHTIRAGVDLVRQLTFEEIPFNNRGSLTFTSGGGFSALANFVDGFSGTQGTFGSKVFGNPVVYPNRFQQAYFVNDSWRVMPNLTLNIGLRYENYGTPENVLPFPAFAGVSGPITTVAKQKADNNNFSPRFSFAYTFRKSSGFLGKVLGNDKTVLRGGYSIAYDVFFDNILVNTGAASPNVFGVTTLGSSVGGRGFANAGVNSLPSTGSPNPLTGITTIDPNLVNPQTHLWNLGVQRELPGKVILDVAYVGSRGERLFINEQFNPGINGVREFATRGPITVRTNGGDSIYHSLQTRVEKGFNHGLLFRFAYTYSKAIDNVDSEVFTTSGGSSFTSNNAFRGADRSVASFDAPHRAVWTVLYDLPSPKDSRLLRAVFGNYTVSGVYRLQSGAVQSAFVGGVDLNGDLNAGNDRPAISNINAPATSVAILDSIFGLSSPTGYVDASGNPISPKNARYIVDPSIRTNIVGRNTLRAPRTNIFDLSLDKAIPMPFEGHKLDIRVQFFNVFNHSNFTFDGTNSSTDVLTPLFNRPTLNDGGNLLGASANRTGQIQVRYSF